jgi:transposase-like protein
MTKIVKRYSEAFKRQVVSEYEAGNEVRALQSKYAIGGNHTIQNWIRRYGREGFRHELVYIQRGEEKGRMRELEEQVEELEQALGRMTLEKLKLESILEVLQGKAGEVGKKNAPGSSKPCGSKRENSSESG